jgi:hypothetical protein
MCLLTGDLNRGARHFRERREGPETSQLHPLGRGEHVGRRAIQQASPVGSQRRHQAQELRPLGALGGGSVGLDRRAYTRGLPVGDVGRQGYLSYTIRFNSLN